MLPRPEYKPCAVELDEDKPCPNETDEMCARCAIAVCWSHKVDTFQPLYGSSSVEDASLCPTCAADVLEELAMEAGDLRDHLRMRGISVPTPKTKLPKQ